MEFTKGVLAQKRVRLIGVCFGHQVIGRAMGVKVDRSDRGWEVSVSPVQLTQKGKDLFGVEELVCSHHLMFWRGSMLTLTAGYTPDAPRYRLRVAKVGRASGLFTTV